VGTRCFAHPTDHVLATLIESTYFLHHISRQNYLRYITSCAAA
jgi:hypothetical protein